MRPSWSRAGRRTGALDLYDPHLIVHMIVADEAEIALLAASGKSAARALRLVP